MKDVRQLLESAAAPMKRLTEESKTLVAKWEKTGLLEGIENPYEKSGMAILLENQAKQLIQESSRTGTATNSEEWSGVALPLVRRVFSEIAAKDFVSVQPMNLPSGLVFYLEFKYGTAQPGFLTNQGKNSQRDSIHGVTNTSSTPSQGLYGAGRFGYSINEVSSSTLTRDAAAPFVPTSTTFTTGSMTATDFNFDSAFSASLAASTKYKTITVASASLKNNPTGTAFDAEGIRAFKISGSGIKEFYPAFTRISSDDTLITFVVSASTVTNAVITYHNQPTSTTRGDFESPSPSTQTNPNIDIPEINIELRSEAIVAKTRKLKAIWTPEFSQDLNAYHAVDAEAELTSMLSEYISQEIDLEILDMLLQNAVTTDYWSAAIGRQYNTATGAFANDANIAGQAYNQGTWFQTLGTKIAKVSNAIHQKTMRGGANFLVCSPAVATIIESIPGFAGDGDGSTWGKNSFAFGVQKVGTFKGQYQVYKNPYMLENTILMGYRGSQFLETGAVYAPYVPLIMTPLVYDPDNLTPRKGVMTRYAKKMVRPEFYGKIYIEKHDSI